MGFFTGENVKKKHIVISTCLSVIYNVLQARIHEVNPLNPLMNLILSNR